MNPLDNRSEKDLLNRLATNYSVNSPYSTIKKSIIFDEIAKFVTCAKEKTVLQLGLASGQETTLLADTFAHVDVVDGSSKFIDMATAKNSYDNVKYIYSLFEEYETERKYDYIYSTYVFEHVLSPEVILKKLKAYLSTDGLIFITVPNANSFSRHLAKEIGLVSDLYALTENDLSVGHRRVYDSKELERTVISAGYEIVAIRGIIFKILADFQLNRLLSEKIISEKLIWGLQKMGDKNVDYCDSVLCVARA